MSAPPAVYLQKVWVKAARKLREGWAKATRELREANAVEEKRLNGSPHQRPIDALIDTGLDAGRKHQAGRTF